MMELEFEDLELDFNGEFDDCAEDFTLGSEHCEFCESFDFCYEQWKKAEYEKF